MQASQVEEQSVTGPSVLGKRTADGASGPDVVDLTGPEEAEYDDPDYTVYRLQEERNTRFRLQMWSVAKGLRKPYIQVAREALKNGWIDPAFPDTEPWSAWVPGVVPDRHLSETYKRGRDTQHLDVFR